MNKLFMLGAMLVALATAGPALADHGQSTDHSVLTVQIGSGNVSPAAAVSAPVDADAPVCVASICSNAAGNQESGGATAGTDTGSDPGSGSSTPTDQSAVGSVGTVQVGTVDVAPAAAVAAPVAVDAPVCVAAACSSRSGSQTTGPATSTTTSGQSGPGEQSTHASVGTVQVGTVDVAPAAAVAAPVRAAAPVCVLASCSSTAGGQQTGTTTATTSSAGPGPSHPGDQTTHGSIGTVQIGSADVDPAVAVSAPVDAHTPVCVLAACGGGSTGGGSTGGGSTGGGGNTTGGGGGTTGVGSGSTHTTGSEATSPATPVEPITAVWTTGSADERNGSPEPASTAGRPDRTTDAGVLGSGAGTSTAAVDTAAGSVAAAGELPFSGLRLVRDLALGLALMVAGLFTRALSTAQGRCL